MLADLQAPPRKEGPRWLYVMLAIVSTVAFPAAAVFFVVGIGFVSVGLVMRGFARQDRSDQLGQRSIRVGGALLVGPAVFLVVVAIYVAFGNAIN